MLQTGDLKRLKGAVYSRALEVRMFMESANSQPVAKTLHKIRLSNKLGQKMIKGGFALIAIPDPISDLPGAGLVVAGYALKSISSVGIEDLSYEVSKTSSDMKELRTVLKDTRF